VKTLVLLILVAVGSALGYHYYIAPRLTISTDADGVESAAFKESVKRSQKTAVNSYPDLGKLNSKFNVRFRSGLAEWRRMRDQRLQHSNWPEKLAAEIASQPADISLNIGNGKALHFNTMEQKNAYELALDRTRAAANSTPPPRQSNFNSDALEHGRLHSGSDPNLHK
jgi:hypothetical protein